MLPRWPVICSQESIFVLRLSQDGRESSAPKHSTAAAFSRADASWRTDSSTCCDLQWCAAWIRDQSAQNRSCVYCTALWSTSNWISWHSNLQMVQNDSIDSARSAFSSRSYNPTWANVPAMQIGIPLQTCPRWYWWWRSSLHAYDHNGSTTQFINLPMTFTDIQKPMSKNIERKTKSINEGYCSGSAS